MYITLLVVAGAGYWVDAKLGLGIGAFLYDQYGRVFPEKKHIQPHLSHELYYEMPAHLASLAEKITCNRVNGFISVLSDTLSELSGGVIDAFTPGR